MLRPCNRNPTPIRRPLSLRPGLECLEDRSLPSTTLLTLADPAALPTAVGGTTGRQPVSGDGRFVVFSSSSVDLAAEQVNNATQVFLLDRQSGALSIVSRATDGSLGNGSSNHASISADGRFVVFQSTANLTPGDTDSSTDVFVRDLQLGTTALVSVASDGAKANNTANAPVISDDGRFVAFQSIATNLVPGDTNNNQDIFVHDRQAATTRRINVLADGTQALGPGCDLPVISGDGRYVAYNANTTNLVPGDGNAGNDVLVYDLHTGVTSLVSVNSAGQQDNGHSAGPAISADGRYVAFVSTNTNLDGSIGGLAVFLRDLRAGTTRRLATVGFGSSTVFGFLTVPISISGDGRFVGFASPHATVVPDDTNGLTDAFVVDAQTLAVRRVTVASDGAQLQGSSNTNVVPALNGDGSVAVYSSNGGSLFPGVGPGTFNVYTHTAPAGQTSLLTRRDPGLPLRTASVGANPTRNAVSGDGRFVVYTSLSPELVPGDTNGRQDVFLHDRKEGTRTRITAAFDGAQINNTASAATISADGRFVAFTSTATNLVAGDTNGRQDVFVFDRQSGATSRVSVGPAGAQANNSSSGPVLSADGRYVAFSSDATNLVAGDTNNQSDVFVHDRQTGVTSRISVSTAGAQGNNFSSGPSVSADGRYVAFVSAATNLVAGDTNGFYDLFVRDRQTNVTTRISVGPGGVQGNNYTWGGVLSADGRFVAYTSDASNLVPGDTNGFTDVFLHDRQAGATSIVNVSSAGARANNWTSDVALSADGRFVAYTSDATNLVDGDTNGATDVFVHDRQTGSTIRGSRGPNGEQGGAGSSTPSLSADGGALVFSSDARNFGERVVFVSNVYARSLREPPAARPDAYNVAEGDVLTVGAPGVLANDTDASDDPLTARVVIGPSRGTLSLNADGSFVYTPAADFHGVDRFTYVANNGAADSPPSEVTIDISPVNDAPVARADEHAMDEDAVLTVDALGALGNDTDADGDALTAVLVSGTTHGALTLNADGSFVYTPDANFHGVDGFTYVANDGTLDGEVTTVTLTVNPINDAPLAGGDGYLTNEGTPLSVPAPGVLGNDSDVEGDALTAVLVSAPAHGTLALDADGSFVYTPDAGYFGPDAFAYAAHDGDLDGPAATVSLRVNGVPRAAGDHYQLYVNQDNVRGAAGGVLGNDTDPDGEPLTAGLVSGPRFGQLTLDADGSFSYRPIAGYVGFDRFVYLASDGFALSVPVEVHLTVNRERRLSETDLDRGRVSHSSAGDEVDAAPVRMSLPDGHVLAVAGVEWDARRGTPGAVTVRVNAGLAGPSLLRDVANLARLEAVVLESRGHRWTLQDVTFTSVNSSADLAPGGGTVDALTLAFESLTVESTSAGGTARRFELRNGARGEARLDGNPSAAPRFGGQAGAPAERTIRFSDGTVLAIDAYAWSVVETALSRDAAGAFTVTLPADRALPGLLYAAASGFPLSDVQISTTVAATRKGEGARLSWDLETVEVASAAVSMDADGLAVVRLTLRLPGGGRGQPNRVVAAVSDVSTSWDVADSNRETSTEGAARPPRADTPYRLSLPGGRDLNVLGFAWEVRRGDAGTMRVRVPGGAGTPELFALAVLDDRLEEVVLKGKEDTDGPPHTAWTLRRVRIVEFRTGADGAAPVDEVVLSFDRIVVEAGQRGGRRSFEWDTERTPRTAPKDFGRSVAMAKRAVTFADGTRLAVDAVAWRARNPVTFGTRIGPADPGVFEVTAVAGAALPKLLHAAATGTRLDGAVELLDDILWQMQGVRVTSVRVHEPTIDGPPVVVFTLSFEMLTVATADGKQTTTWDVERTRVTGYDGFDGEAPRPGAPSVQFGAAAELPLADFDWAVGDPLADPDARLGDLGRVRLTLPGGPSSLGLLAAVARGTEMPSVVLRAGGFAFELENVYVEEYAPGFGAPDAVTLTFERVVVRRGSDRVTLDRSRGAMSSGGGLFGGTSADTPITLTLGGNVRIPVTSFTGGSPDLTRRQPGPITVTAPLDPALLGLLHALASGATLDGAVLSYANGRGRWTLGDVAVTAVRVAFSADGNATLTFTLVPGRLTARYDDGTGVLPLEFAATHSIDAGTPLSVPVDTYGDGLTVVGYIQGRHGSVTLLNGRLVYLPAVDFVGDDEFFFTISNGTFTATVRIRVSVRGV